MLNWGEFVTFGNVLFVENWYFAPFVVVTEEC